MPFITTQKFNASITSKPISPVYILGGAETYFINSCLSKIESKLLADNLNKEVFFVPDTDANAIDKTVSEILNSLQTMPFLSEKRVVVVKNVQNLFSKESDENRADVILNYVDNPSEASVLIMTYEKKLEFKKESSAYKLSDKGMKLLTSCSKSENCIMVDCNRVSENQIPQYIKNEFAQRGKTADIEVISKLMEENGQDLLSSLNEIEKVSLFAGQDKKKITIDDLVATSGYAKELGPFALSNAIEEKNLKLSLFIVEQLFANGQENTNVLFQISSAVRKLLTSKSMLEEQGMPEEKSVNIKHDYVRKKFFANLNKHSINKLKESLNLILKADKSIKTEDGNEFFKIEEVVIYLCS
ncbi:MAG: DNA polymerase III subunit delta [Elusimicrobiota bacterium]|jgi:DNA polymerase-3 subunit delta|nr:DNA polymerase III subunit delta [Elusimicrobiota bacterium]